MSNFFAWTRDLEQALCATYVVATERGVSFDEAIDLIRKDTDITDLESLSEYCFYVCFGSTVTIPGRKSLREIMDPLLKSYGMTFEEWNESLKNKKLFSS